MPQRFKEQQARIDAIIEGTGRGADDDCRRLLRNARKGISDPAALDPKEMHELLSAIVHHCEKLGIG